MRTIDNTKPVLVTGGTGYIASWIIHYLLQDGHQVRTTVRDTSNKEKTAHLQELADKAEGTLAFYQADLLEAGSFNKAMKDVELVIHTASPFFISGIKDPQKQLIEPAQQGTRNVLESANKHDSVKRVVVTSSVAAIYSDNADIKNTPDQVFTEKDWNTGSSLKHQPYNYSKTLAEQEAWRMAEEQDRWDLLTINPGFVLGPSLTKRKDSTSIDFMVSMLNGKYKMGFPDLYFGFVDVRDVAQAHIRAGYTPEASGRHILVSETMGARDVAAILRENLNGNYPLPKRTLPTFLLYLFGPMQGFSWSFIGRNIGVPIQIDNSYSKKDLGLEYTPIAQTLQEHVKQLEADGLIA